VSSRIIDPALLAAEPGPHPAASPFDKRVSDALGISAFAVYAVDLPPGAETVRHDHLDDGAEDLYVVVSGDGWVVVDGEETALVPGLFVAVTEESTRHLRAGTHGLALVAVCGTPPGATSG
jgi:uncharacterized cupin superfamily protein